MLEDLSFGKILLIVLVLVIFFGAKRIPEIAQSLGKGVKEFKKAVKDIREDPEKKSEEKK
ncbi:MAG TPA: twin-arginine translocase TatA/TatE family subunit [Candidatus Acidoferrales bacterium]|nr:twin-arginine translocase TatA/TatE family subunit [Candidatus Acidoferrales bacterium]